MFKNKSVYDYILVAAATSLLFILGAVVCGYPQEFSVWSGRHNWLTGSTVKFLNNWLAEWPSNINFLMLENPDSIEFPDMAARVPYVSYPSGVLIIPYLIAKLCGMQYAGLTFIEVIAVGFFLADTVIISFLFFMTGRHCTTIRNSDVLIYASVTLGLLWSMLPASQYYLKHVFFSDQSVLLFIYLMTLMEFYLWTHEAIYTAKRKKILFFSLRLAVLFIGMWTDYYFWIFIFIAFFIRFITDRKKLSLPALLIRLGKEYIIPVLLSVAAFALQISSVPNGWELLRDIFLIRTSSTHEGTDIRQNIFAFIDKSLTTVGMILLFVGIAAFIVYLLSFILKRGKSTGHREAEGTLCRIGSLILFPPIAQIIILTNHSGVHEFSIIKLGLPFVFSIFFLVFLLYGKAKKARRELFRKYASVFILLIPFLCAHIIFVGGRYYHERISEGCETDFKGEELADTVRDYFNSYDLVLFSCSEEVPQNPPNLLARTGKRIYHIDTLSDIKSQFPTLNQSARKILIVYKEDIGNTENEILWQKLDTFKPLYETKNYFFYELP